MSSSCVLREWSCKRDQCCCCRCSSSCYSRVGRNTTQHITRPSSYPPTHRTAPFQITHCLWVETGLPLSYKWHTAAPQFRKQITPSNYSHTPHSCLCIQTDILLLLLLSLWVLVRWIRVHINNNSNNKEKNNQPTTVQWLCNLFLNVQWTGKCFEISSTTTATAAAAPATLV